MGQQTKTIVKRRRRKLYLKRKKELIKIGGITKKSATPKAPAAKKAAPKKPAAKKAPAKKPAEESTAVESSES